jgi:hypothetical protein
MRRGTDMPPSVVAGRDPTAHELASRAEAVGPGSTRRSDEEEEQMCRGTDVPRNRYAALPSVVAGLDPATHGPAGALRKAVGPRGKPGDDKEEQIRRLRALPALGKRCAREQMRRGTDMLPPCRLAGPESAGRRPLSGTGVPRNKSAAPPPLGRLDRTRGAGAGWRNRRAAEQICRRLAAPAPARSKTSAEGAALVDRGWSLAIFRAFDLSAAPRRRGRIPCMRW